MKILVYGAGAVGGYLGGRLARHGHDVTLITREVTADFINEHGLDITENDETIKSHPKAVVSVAQAFADDAQYDVIIMSMKSYDLVSAMDPLVAFCPHPKLIITTQNGIDVERPLVEQFGAETVIAGSVTTPLRRETSYHIIVERADRGLALSALHKSQNVKQWVTIFNNAGINSTAVNSYESMKWSKVFLNIVGNASSAILCRKPGIIYKSDNLFDVEMRMLRETLAVMEARNIKLIDLPGSPATKLALSLKLPRTLVKPILTKQVSSGRGDKMPSFYYDLQSDKGKTEVVYHNGAIAAAGKKLGIPTPVNAAYNDVLVGLTKHEEQWDDFSGKPNNLLKVVDYYTRNKEA